MATASDVTRAGDRIGFTPPQEHKEDYLALLQKTDAACAEILSYPDYHPVPDTQRWPRRNVHLPEGEENPLKGWAWKADVGDALECRGKILSGKRVVLKDTVCLAGVPLQFGTSAFINYTPQQDATVVTRIFEHGGLITGKATCENFSHGATSSSSAYGPVENPYARGFSAGGSSSGCGALIGSGAADMGIGGDQGGSIRIPAAFCGIVGLKPTFGLVPYTGVLSSDSALDHVGPMASTVQDAARLLEAVAGYDGLDDRQLGAPAPDRVQKYSELLLKARQGGLKGMRIGWLREAFENPSIASSVAKSVHEAIDRFQQLGATVEEVSVPLFKSAPSMSHVLNKLASGGTRSGRQVGRRGVYVNDYWDQLLPWTQDKFDKAKYFVTGTAMSCEYGWGKYPTVYGRAVNLGCRLRDDFNKLFETYDIILLPTVPQPARRHIASDAGPLGWANASPGAVSFTSAFNITGHPAMSIPVGLVPPMTDDIQTAEDANIRLPAGMMLVGKFWDEATILRAGDAWERSVDWKSLVLNP